MKRINKSLIMGEDTPKDVDKDHRPAIGVGECIWCDKEVYSSKTGYSQEKVEGGEEMPKDHKALHKLCFIEILEVARMTLETVTKHVRIKELN